MEMEQQPLDSIYEYINFKVEIQGSSMTKRNDNTKEESLYERTIR
jgi:hypothetical protein